MTDHCSVSTSNSIEKFEERRSVLNVRNATRRRLVRVKVDGCMVVAGKRCDWLLIDEESGTEIFIELKGADVGEGVKQICASADALSKKPSKRFGYIVCTRSPLSSPEIQRLQKQLLKTHLLSLRVKTTIHNVDIESLVGETN
ncbi:hypothetical protein V2L00_23385 [Pseudomonas alliivorans]|nr:hypothetical protein [Pseudomonas alliivorans]